MQDKQLPKRQYTEEFKTEAVRLSESVGGHEAARRLGVPVSDCTEMRDLGVTRLNHFDVLILDDLA